jgi:hypothetical protein
VFDQTPAPLAVYMHTLADIRSLVNVSGIVDLHSAGAALAWHLPKPLLAAELDIGYLKEAAYCLHDYLLPETREQASDYLHYLASIFTLLDLYQHSFPREFARSKKSILPAKDAAYSERELELFELISERKFPLPYYLQDTVLGRDEREYGFPIGAFGREWWDDDLRYWDPGWRMLLWVMGEVSPEDIESSGDGFPLDPRIFELSVKQGERFATEALTLHCRTLSGALAYLAIALKILWHDTGCWFLDINPEQAHDYLDYSQDSMELLSKQGQLYGQYTGQADQLITWIESDPLENLQEVITLWNQFVLEEKDSPVMLRNHPPQS